MQHFVWRGPGGEGREVSESGLSMQTTLCHPVLLPLGDLNLR
jgi:hypothetical protein